MDLAGRIAAHRAGERVPEELLGEFRRTPLLVPLHGDGLLTGDFGGIGWLYAFTDTAALARFTPSRGPADASAGGPAADGPPAEPSPHVTLLGAHLLDVVIPSLAEPTGVVVNVADAENAMLFPPVRGIVPDAVAVDLDARGGRGDRDDGEGRDGEGQLSR